MSTSEAFTGLPPRREPGGLLTLADLTPDRLAGLARRSVELYRDRTAHHDPLQGLLIGIVFTRTSTRTRTAFTAGVERLGGRAIGYGPGDLQTNTGESLADTARMFGLMLDGIVTRTAGPLADMRLLSAESGLPVINAMAAEEHPTQGICDLATILLHRGSLDGARVLYVGEGNNTATALAQGLSAFAGTELHLLTPDGYGLPEDALKAATARAAGNGGHVTESHDPRDVPAGAEFVYTTRWQTTGTSKPDAAWRETFRPFHIDDQFLGRTPDALFLHDLPAHRGEEVSGAVLDGPRSVAWSQARMKLCSAMAVLEYAFGRD
ncbi:ornithine carbamoyltransferase [Actinoplanes sp. SE50]|uniref:ornithine carbamoyltransferase n=1 Tax=unclassified Actinoplanes TaxID=2626549 RepID=UPI00023EC3D3|nr:MULTISPECIES: ornithine carbamoyltransferase [unclassified Actinoplanes]AEV81896.1 ornithine carbamoyltransferase [Actinoplanes sp. SE50/110]ATO80297.1 ornithine carbamoyltransferase [Actinoplanes sp. SE50]SLL97702.1 ornithine carbamoyltransferase [Actinoplanes sp. SE50/110]